MATDGKNLSPNNIVINSLLINEKQKQILPKIIMYRGKPEVTLLSISFLSFVHRALRFGNSAESPKVITKLIGAIRRLLVLKYPSCALVEFLSKKLLDKELVGKTIKLLK